MPSLYMAVLAPSVILLPITIAVLKYGYWKHASAKRMAFAYLLFSAFFNIVASVTTYKNVNNLPLLHLYTVLEFWIIVILFRCIFKGNRIRKLLIYLAIAFSIFSVIYIMMTDSLFAYNTLSRFLESIMIVGFCIYFLYLDFSNIASNESMFNFSVIVGLLLYFSSASILFGLSNAILKNRIFNILIWNLHATIMLIMYLIFAWAFLRLKKAS
ncbi:MAG TPA: hypothetical protein VFQ86_02730 [Arachidicoccus soli]|nr:hypothetical protein [Arachidicoccus soli]